jgi:hypothetical protein
MKIIIAGSRTITNYTDVRDGVIQSGLWKKYGKAVEVVSGNARGVDRLGEEFAKRNGLVCHVMPADWNNLGKRAGMVRNCQMGDFADELLAIWDGESRGTNQMIAYMKKLGKPVSVYIPAQFA